MYQFSAQTDNCNFLDQIFPKGYFQSKTDKIDTTILHIRISLCIKFHFEQKSLNFWTKFVQERYLWSKTEKVNITIEFRLFKLVLVPNFSLN